MVRQAEKEQRQSWCPGRAKANWLCSVCFEIDAQIALCSQFCVRLLQELATAGENQDSAQLRRLMTQDRMETGESKGKQRKAKESKGKQRKAKESKGKQRKAKESKGKQRKAKESKGKQRKAKEYSHNTHLLYLSRLSMLSEIYSCVRLHHWTLQFLLRC